MLVLSNVFCGPLISAESASNPVFLYASLSGRPTFDEDARGGNPFATALVQLLSAKSMSFSAFSTDLVALTRQTSKGSQQAEIVGGDHLAQWQFLPTPRHEKRVALVLVFSDYSASNIRRSLPGAKRDHQRVDEALSRAGFVVTSLLNPNHEELAQALKTFRVRTANADVAVIYTTGHGFEKDGIPRVLLPYTRVNRANALPVSELASAARAKRANLIFYAACRNRF